MLSADCYLSLIESRTYARVNLQPYDLGAQTPPEMRTYKNKSPNREAQDNRVDSKEHRAKDLSKPSTVLTIMREKCVR